MMESKTARGALALLLLLGTVAACSTTGEPGDWRGRAIVEVVDARGPATRIVPYPYGGTLYIWEEIVASAPMPDLETAGGGGFGVTRTLRRTTLLVDDEGIVTGTRLDLIPFS